MHFTRFKVKIQNKIKSCLSRNGISYEDDLWNKEGLMWLKKSKDYEIESYLRLYETIVKEENSIKEKIEKVAQSKKETMLLETIPGVGYFGATLIYAEIGDITRFPNVKHLHAYAGVAPGIYQSGTKTRMPMRKSVNYWLKWILIQCAGRITLKNTKPSKLRNYYFKVKNKKGWKTARKATARKMLTIVWYVLNKNIPYRES
jgi:transposase